MRRNSVFRYLSLTVAVVILGGCGDSGLKKFPVARVKGRVLCDGQPVPKAMVFFEPLRTGESALVGKAGFAITDDTGSFILTTYTNGDGAVVGRHRVRVDRTDPNYQCDCVLNSEFDQMEVDIRQGEEHDVQVTLKRKTKADRPLSPREREEAEEV